MGTAVNEHALAKRRGLLKESQRQFVTLVRSGQNESAEGTLQARFYTTSFGAFSIPHMKSASVPHRILVGANGGQDGSPCNTEAQKAKKVSSLFKAGDLGPRVRSLSDF